MHAADKAFLAGKQFWTSLLTSQHFFSINHELCIDSMRLEI